MLFQECSYTCSYGERDEKSLISRFSACIFHDRRDDLACIYEVCYKRVIQTFFIIIFSCEIIDFCFVVKFAYLYVSLRKILIIRISRFDY